MARRTVQQFARNYQLEVERVAEAARGLGLKVKDHNFQLGEHDQERLEQALHCGPSTAAAAAAPPSAAKARASPSAPSTPSRADTSPNPNAPRREAGHPVLCHHEVLSWLEQDGGEALSRRWQLLLAQFAAHGRSLRVKGTQGNHNRGWRRAPLGGNGGSQFYLWWAPAGAGPVRALEAPERSLLLRALRHHDDHAPLLSGSFAEYLEIGTREMLKEQESAGPWTEGQERFSRSTAAVRLLDGSPGTGKTAALWRAVALRAGEKVLFVTLSGRLTELAREHFAAFGAADSEVRALRYADLLGELAGSPEDGRGFARGREEFLRTAEGLGPRILGPWSGRTRALFARLRGALYGWRLPERGARFDAPLEPGQELGLRRGRLLSEEARLALERVVNVLGLSPGAIKRCFPDLEHAWRAGERLAGMKHLPAAFEHLDRIVLDEVQDLTRLEASVLIELARRAGERDLERGAPVFLAAGDEGQTVRPTDFAWGWFKDLLSERLGTPEQVPLRASLRCPPRIADLVNRAGELYEAVQKSERPRGVLVSGAVEGEHSEEWLARSSWTGEARDQEQLEQLAEREGVAFVRLLEREPSWLPKGAREVLCDPEEAKGLDFQHVVLVEPGRLLVELSEAASGDELGGMERRTAIDRLRVALSRATQTLVFLDGPGDGEAEAALDEFLAGQDVPRLAPAAWLELLLQDEAPLEERVRRAVEEAQAYELHQPQLAWRRAAHAVQLLVHAARAQEQVEESLKLECWRVHLRLGLELAGGDRPEALTRQELLQGAADSARKSGLRELGAALEAGLALERAPLSGRAQLLHKLLSCLEAPSLGEGWLPEALARLKPHWREALGAALDLAAEANALSSSLARFAQRLCAGEEQRAQLLGAWQVRAGQCLLDARLHKEALKLAQAMQGESPIMAALKARVFESNGEHAQAARWFETALRLEDALRNWRDAADFAQAQRVALQLEQSVPALDWLRALEDLAQGRPPLDQLREAEVQWLKRQSGKLWRP